MTTGAAATGAVGAGAFGSSGSTGADGAAVSIRDIIEVRSRRSASISFFNSPSRVLVSWLFWRMMPMLFSIDLMPSRLIGEPLGDALVRLIEATVERLRRFGE